MRADTIDLQDQSSPSASEHHKPQLEGGLAAHQRAEVHHVYQERSSEEHALADAWKMTDNLTEEPEAIDDAQQLHYTNEPSLTNGVHHEHEEGMEERGADGDADGDPDADDDMMDRISSSPSIDDGGYTLSRTSTPAIPGEMIWPERKSSLSPSPRETPISTPPSRAIFDESASSTPGSSPCLQTPLHLPLHVRRTGRAASPLLRSPD